MTRIDEELFLSLEKYYGKPRKNNKNMYKRRYQRECFICKYIRNKQAAYDRFFELFEKYTSS
tara:strand:+ start:771 stop:956 length:186 start_codon:yes stop_codon:yes gene_type:complete